MITNIEMNERHFLRKSEKLPSAYAKLGDKASDAEIAAEIGVVAGDILRLKRHLETGYHAGGFKLWDISDKTGCSMRSAPSASASTASIWTNATPTSPPRWRVS